VLRDAFGRERAVFEQQYVAAGLLAEGLSSFNLSLGLRRQALATESFQYASPAFLGVYRRGLSDRLTGGVRLEASRNLVSGGSTFSFGLPVGELELTAAGSFVDQRAGIAGSASYLFLARRLGVQASVRGMSAPMPR
jgi:outer membrane usher protein